MSKRNNLLYIAVLGVAFIILYYPIWIVDYLYTDEAVQLWLYGKQPDFEMFSEQGRVVTEKLMLWLFGSADKVSDLKWVRGFSFLGWLICIPIWYSALTKIVRKEGLPNRLPFWITLFLICVPSLTISVVWASCLELFIANTAGLLSGYFFFMGIKESEGRRSVSSKGVWLGLGFGVLSLFTYQNGIGCFFLPFVLHAISERKKMGTLIIGIGFFLLVSVVYFMLFKYSLQSTAMAASERTSLHIAPWTKLKFFFTRPMSTAFHFTCLFNEKNLLGYWLYVFFFGLWLLSYWVRSRVRPIKESVTYLVLLLLMLGLSYLPSLLVKENYASNRTLLALNLLVFALVAESLLHYAGKQRTQSLVIGATSLLFLGNAWYNTRYLFIQPVEQEWVRLKSHIGQAYQPQTTTVYFVRPAEDFFVNQKGITRSWDEFGVPSSFFDWVPEYLVKQVVYEKTGNRALAQKLVVKSWLGKDAFEKSGEKLPENALLIDAEAVLKE